MAEDWNAIAAEVDAAFQSVANVSQPDSYPATLRIPRATVSTNAWDPLFNDVAECRHARNAGREWNAGRADIRMLTCSATGVEPHDDWQIAAGVAQPK